MSFACDDSSMIPNSSLVPDSPSLWHRFKACCATFIEYHANETLKCGPIPRHIAFIMDGNRRFARKQHKETQTGHYSGGETLRNTLQWCQDLGINTVTVFAFSIENFKRAAEEVNYLMTMATQKLIELGNNECVIRAIGEISLLPPELQAQIEHIEELTKNNPAGNLNICFSYTSTHEITAAVRSVLASTECGEVEPENIDSDQIERAMISYGSPDVDIIIRTSGEIRLSDFMLWQSSASCLVITDVLWPEFTAYHLKIAILHYQGHHDQLMEIRSRLKEKK